MAQSGHLIKDGSTNSQDKPVYVKSDGTLADARISIQEQSSSESTYVNFPYIPKVIFIDGTSGNSRAIAYTQISRNASNPTYMMTSGGTSYYAYISNSNLRLNWCNSDGSSMTGLRLIAIF